MRNTIYFSIIAVLIILSGCKGNSFLKRHYTNFSRGHQHIALKENATLKHKTAELSVAVAVSKEISRASAPEESALLSANLNSSPLAASKAHYFKALPKNVFQAVQSPENDSRLNNSSAGTTVSKKTADQKKHTFKTIIGELLSIVLYLVLLCVLVAAIILLVILL